ncbi:3-epi-6-deoxocathasterone 23-monooxygenase CYP90C1-like [Aristolochia californica]|uniref:3-epi-6-deoxocathasterone 23-monooxygenase CYP90C1-like n=1 Tax=Aristolochia californica TaxID=171875 RepID=UPI0035E11670
MAKFQFLKWQLTFIARTGFLLWWFWRRQSERRQTPKGCLGWPLIGETVEFIACGRSSNPVSFMQKRRVLYGKVFKSHLLGRPIIVSTDAEVNKVVLQNNGSIFEPFYPRSISLLLGESSILKINGNLRRRVHGLIGCFLKSPGLKDQVTRKIKDLMQLSMREWNEGQLVFIQDEARKIAFQVLAGVLMGIEPGEEMDLLMREFRVFSDGLICVPVKLPGTTLYNSLKAKERMKQLVEKIIKEKMKKSENGTVKDVIDVLLNEMDSKKDGQLTVDFICGNIIEMMIPGEDSVPMLITLAVKYLSDSPLALKQLLEENMELKRRKIHLGQEYECADYMSLEFTQDVINESLRLGNIVVAIWRKALKDVNINGYLIPRGWCVMASFSSIHLDEENYGNPYDFNPWRWQKNESKVLSNNFTPFGGGQRLCPGLELSRLEASIFLHHLVTNQRWVAEEDYIVNFPIVKLKRRMPIRVSPI